MGKGAVWKCEVLDHGKDVCCLCRWMLTLQLILWRLWQNDDGCQSTEQMQGMLSEGQVLNHITGMNNSRGTTRAAGIDDITGLLIYDGGLHLIM